MENRLKRDLKQEEIRMKNEILNIDKSQTIKDIFLSKYIKYNIKILILFFLKANLIENMKNQF